MPKIHLSHINDKRIIKWLVARYYIVKSRDGVPQMDDKGNVTFKGRSVDIPSFEWFLKKNKWLIYQFLEDGVETAASAEVMTYSQNVKHSADCLESAVYKCVIECNAKGYKGENRGVVDIPEKHLKLQADMSWMLNK